MRNLLPAIARRLLKTDRDRADVLNGLIWQLPQLTYTRLADRGFRPGAVIDIGANVGNWTRMTKPIFPDTAFLMIEARQEESEALSLVCYQLPNVEYKIALLGAEPRRMVDFHCCESGSSIFRERSDARQTDIRLDMGTLDDVLSAHPGKLESPLFLKLDLQGGELGVLRGAPATLARSEIVQIEVPLLDYNEGAPSVLEVLSFMDERGFCIFDIAGFTRPNGVDLAQIDILFVPKHSTLRRDFFAFRKRD